MQSPKLWGFTSLVAVAANLSVSDGMLHLPCSYAISLYLLSLLFCLLQA